MAEEKGFRLFCIINMMLSVRLRHHPAAESRAEGKSDFGTPFVQRLSLYHVSELHRSDSELVD